MTTLATNALMNLNGGVGGGADRESYTDALSRFSAQTQELKRLLKDDDAEVASATTMEDNSELESTTAASDEEASSSDEEDSSDYESSDDDDEDDSDWEDELDNLEAVLQGTAPAKMLVKKTNSSPALMAMNVSIEQAEENILPGFVNLKDRMRNAANNSYLQELDYTTKTKPETVASPFAATNPEEHLKNILEGFSAASFPSETWHDYFLKMTDEHIDAHTTEVEAAIRAQDYETMRTMLRQGHTLQTCNKHGESIVHIACRRGTGELVDFLINEAGVSTRIRDDMGRTPLHDACWTHKPNFKIVMLLLEVSPELLFIVDHRGATPLTYIPREAWAVWCEFLQENRQFLRDMVKGLRFDRARYFIKNMVPCLKF